MRSIQRSDVQGAVRLALRAGVVAGVYGKPRTYGVTASWRFGAAYQ